MPFPDDDPLISLAAAFEHTVKPEAKLVMQTAMQLLDELNLDRGEHLTAVVTAVVGAFAIWEKR